MRCLRNKICIPTVVFILVFSLVPFSKSWAHGEPSEPTPEPTLEETLVPGSYYEDEVIVVFNDDITSTEAKEILQPTDSVDEESISEDSILADDAVVADLAEGSTVEEAIAELSANPDVAYVQPNYRYEPLDDPTAEEGELLPPELLSPLATVINDPYASSQWALSNTRLYDTWSLVRANYTVGVAVIDTGVNTEHEDLVGTIIPGSYYDATLQGVTGDPYHHGTQVAGIIAAEANNGKGVAGVSYNARILPICTGYYDAGNNYVMSTAYVVRAINHLFEEVPGTGQTIAQYYNIKVINISLGGVGRDQQLEVRINQAYAAGILTVGAAGNANSDEPYYPASFDKCINVAGLSAGAGFFNEVRYISSNYGDTIDLAAPGVNIYSTTYNGGYSSDNNGTSFAAPYVSGVAALLFAAKPGATVDEVRSTLETTAVDLGAPGWDPYFGWGEVNPYAAALHIGVTGIANTESMGPNKPITCTLKTTLPMPTTWLWSVQSGNASITSAGVLTPTTAGKVTVRATYAEDSAVHFDKQIIIPQITPYPTGGITYTGKEIELGYAVIYDGTTLTRDVDYSITYSNNIEVGTATALIKSKGTTDWNGQEEKTFTISPAPLTAANVTVPSVDFTGKEVKPAPMVTFTNGYGNLITLVKDTDYTVTYSNNKDMSASGAMVTVVGKGRFTGSVTKTFSIKGVALSYETHVQSIGWQGAVKDGAVAGTTGRGLRLEGLKLDLLNTTGIKGGIEYATHIQSIGWQKPVVLTSSGASSTLVQGGLSGTTGRGLRLEAMTIKLTGDLAKSYDVYYRVHAQSVGWMGWAKNGEQAGTAGFGLRLEALQICLVPKGGTAPGATFKGVAGKADTPRMMDSSAAKTGLKYTATVHVQSIGDKYYSSATGATLLGTTGKGLRLEAMGLSLKNAPYAGDIKYAAHVQSIGWQDAVQSGQMAGTLGRGLRLEAVRISLTGDMAAHYDVYYRTHVQHFGWTGWAKNGQSCGSAGYGYRMEAMQVVVVPKGVAPGVNAGYFYQR